MNTTSIDNIYPAGTRIYAKVDPSLQLIIAKYYQRIYYCAVAGNPDHKHFAYFERELIAPDVTPKKVNEKWLRPEIRSGTTRLAFEIVYRGSPGEEEQIIAEDAEEYSRY